MKKLHRKCAVHPSPSPPVSDHLALLPAAMLTLAAALSQADREVLAYLISCSSRGNTQKAPEKYKKDHSPVFTCDCFRCYTSYWVRWDTSANRQLIHEIIDAFEDEDGLANNKRAKGRRDKRRRRARAPESTRPELAESTHPSPSVVEATTTPTISCGGGSFDGGEVVAYGGGGGGGGDGGVAGEANEEKGSVSKFVSFIGERFWGVWT